MEILLAVVLVCYLAGRAIWAAIFGGGVISFVPLLGILIAIEELVRGAEYSWIFAAGLLMYVLSEAAVQLLGPYGSDQRKSRFVRLERLSNVRHARRPSSPSDSDAE